MVAGQHEQFGEIRGDIMPDQHPQRMALDVIGRANDMGKMGGTVWIVMRLLFDAPGLGGIAALMQFGQSRQQLAPIAIGLYFHGFWYALVGA